MVAFLLISDLLSYLGGEEDGAAEEESLAAHAGGLVVGVFATAALRAASGAAARITGAPSSGGSHRVFTHNLGIL